MPDNSNAEDFLNSVFNRNKYQAVIDILHKVLDEGLDIDELYNQDVRDDYFHKVAEEIIALFEKGYRKKNDKH